jgi:hypothetical protein
MCERGTHDGAGGTKRSLVVFGALKKSTHIPQIQEQRHVAPVCGQRRVHRPISGDEITDGGCLIIGRPLRTSATRAPRVDDPGNLYFADYRNFRVGKVAGIHYRRSIFL